MESIRKYGQKPFNIAVLHGGPGAAGEMAPLARELSDVSGVLEPLQTAATLEGQVQELRAALEENGSLPVSLIGFSWGATLGYILAARYPALVKKLILVGGGPFEEKYAAAIMDTRLNRLGQRAGRKVVSTMAALEDPTTPDKGGLFALMGKLMTKADSYDPLPRSDEVLEYRHDIYKGVWPQAAELRRSCVLLELGRRIRCPVVAIHGDYDPHPASGVKEPLGRVLKDFRFFLLAKCGHHPWMERQAKDEFYGILKREL
ncbi:MAG: alpha/beta hydrolase [Dehalococcoidales bacterium]